MFINFYNIIAVCAIIDSLIDDYCECRW